MHRSLVIAALAAASLSACGQKQPEVIIDPPPPSNASAGDSGDFGGRGGNSPAGGQQAAAAPVAPPTEAEVKAAATDTSKPHRKAGLWQLAASNGESSSTSTLCVTDASDLRVNAFETRRLLAPAGRPGGGGGGPPGGGGRPGGEGGGGGPGAGPGGGGRPGGGGGGGSPCPPLKISKAGDGWKGSSVCKREFGEVSMTIATSDTLTGDLASKYTLKSTRTVSGSPREEMNRSTTTTVNATYKGACPGGQNGGDLTINGNTINLIAGGGGRPGG